MSTSGAAVDEALEKIGRANEIEERAQQGLDRVYELAAPMTTLSASPRIPAVQIPSPRSLLWPLAIRWRQRGEPLRRCNYDGLTVYYPAWSEIGRSVASGQGWDRMLRPIAADLLGNKRGLIVDVGANIGGSLLELKLGAPNARVLCLEPSRRFARALRRTVRANGWTDVRVMQAAAGADRATRTLFINATTGSMAAAAYGEREPLGAERVPVVTLDDLLRDETELALLKTDTDGFEFDVLTGARETLARLRPALFFEFDPGLIRWAGRDPRDLLHLLDASGYRSFTAWTPQRHRIDVESVDLLAATVPQGEHLNVFARAGG